MRARVHVVAVVALSVVIASLTAIAPPSRADAAGGDVDGFPSGITRLYGVSRYDTAIEVSKKYSPGVPAVFVATGTNFPDALSGAAAAALLGGPLLLTTPTSLPAAVNAELKRLAPAKIYVLGASGAVSNTVSNALAKIAPVQRFGGTSRYDTGLKVVEGIFTSASTAIIATGRDFPDALAATGAAGKLKAPVILVDGKLTSVPTGVMNSLHRMGVTQIAIAGGTGVVSNGIAAQLSSAGYTVSRYGGLSRYETTALINNAFFPAGSSSTMFLATGSNFPDALAGAALAGLMAAPMYITTATCAPAAIYNSVNGLNPSSTVVLGGTAVVDDHAAMNWQCPPGKLYPGTVTAGAFCAKEYSGWYGYTSTGNLMRCMTTAADSRLRWRSA